MSDTQRFKSIELSPVGDEFTLVGDEFCPVGDEFTLVEDEFIADHPLKIKPEESRFDQPNKKYTNNRHSPLDLFERVMDILTNCVHKNKIIIRRKTNTGDRFIEKMHVYKKNEYKMFVG